MGFSSVSKAQQKYNVLFIAIDDLNDWVGFAEGHLQTRTPNMDKLANEGVVFRNSHCTSSECNPSRVSLLTGYHPKTTGFSNNFANFYARNWQGVDEQGVDFAGYAEYPIPEMTSVNTLPQWFMENGYNTMGVGKIFHDHEGDEKIDKKLSWDEWKVVDGVSLFGNHNLNEIYDGKIVWEDWGPVDVKTEDTQDFKRAMWAAEKLKNYKDDKPFFMAVGFKKPHDPFYAPKEFFDMFPDSESIDLPPIKDDDLDDIPYMGKLMADKKVGMLSEYEKIKGENEFGKDFRKDVARAYLATVAYVDSCVGIVTRALKESRYNNNTIVVLWSDHGLHIGEKLHYHKFTFWEEALRHLTLFKVPGIKPGVSFRDVSAFDIYPTLIDLCGLPGNYLEKGFDHQGHSLVPLLKNPDRSWNIPVLTTNYKRFPPMISKRSGETHTDQFLAHGLKTQRWKIIEYISTEDNNYREYELYNLANDPNEWYNLAEKPDYIGVKKKLTQLIHKFPGGEDGQQKENTAPTVIINVDMIVSGSLKDVSLGAEVMDIDGPDEIIKVEFFADGKMLKKDKTFPYEILNTNLSRTKSVTAVAYDKNGNSDSFELVLKKY